MAEQLDLTAPVVAPPRTHYLLRQLILDLDAALVGATVLGDDGMIIYAEYRGQEALDIIQTLNTANLSTTSLVKRVLTKLSNDGKLPPGNVSGVPT